MIESHIDSNRTFTTESSHTEFLRQKRQKRLEQIQQIHTWASDQPEYGRFSSLRLPLDNYDEVFKPELLYSIVENPENVRVLISPIGTESAKRLDITVYETKPNFVSDPKEWHDWESGDSPSRLHQGVHFMHKQLYVKGLIDRNLLTLYDQVIYVVRLKTFGPGASSLYVANYDGERNKGLGKAVWTEVLPNFSKALGFKYIVSMNNPRNISFFIDKTGAKRFDSLLAEEKRDIWPNNQEGVPPQYLTVQMLDN